MNKSPLGVMPKHIWDFKRMEDLKDAIERYKTAGIEVPWEWHREYLQLYELYRDNGKYAKIRR